ncbi:hypothetical protein C0992_010905 [Termitomyces sp. T32_za158]|nr:hypothetical protein C0992_010905 [Termitomyces sp. T32_za158]
MKEYASCYVLYNTAETWTGITEFNTQIPGNQEGAAPRAATYKEWKAAVIGTKESTCYTVNDLHQLAQDTLRMRNARWLLQNGKLYRNEERRLFQQEAYNVEDVLEAGKWALKGTDTSITVHAAPASRPVGNGTPGILPLLPASITSLPTLTAPTNYVKQEDLNKAISTAPIGNATIKAVTIAVTTSPTTTFAISVESLDTVCLEAAARR